MLGCVTRKKSFAEIAAEVRAVPAPSRVVRAGGVNADGDFLDPVGNLLTLVGRIQPSEA